MNSSARARAGHSGRMWPADDLAVAIFAIVTVALATLLAVTHASPAAALAGARPGHGHAGHPPRTLCAGRPSGHRRGPDAPGAYVDGMRYWVQDDEFGTDAR